jgi:RNA polymerase sigma factor (sigma-70 family)
VSPTNSDSRSDEALVAAMALDDETAGLAFVRRYQRRVYGMALAIVNEEGLAEDIAQEALVRVWKHAPVFDVRRGSVTTWVLTITRNLAIDAVRLRRAVPVDPEGVLAFGLVSCETSPEDAAERADAVGRAHRALLCIPREQRRALLLSAYYGLTAEEISERDGIPLGTAKTRIRAGLAKVRAALDEGRVPEVAERS